MDLFGTTCHFFIDDKQKHYTTYEGIFSIFSILLFIFLSFNDFKRETPISITSSSLLSEIQSSIKIYQQNISIPRKIINSSQSFIYHKNLLFPIISYGKKIKVQNKRRIIEDKKISYKLCSETSMKNLDKNVYKINEPLNEIYCLKINHNKDINEEIERGLDLL